MAKSSRSSAIKKNNQNLKRKVFGPVETARNERQSAKLLELAQQPKPARAEMEIEQDDSTKDAAKSDTTDTAMDVDSSKSKPKPDPKSNRSIERIRHAKVRKPEQRHRRARNNIVFKKHPMKPSKKGSKR